jgi:MFS family permease
VLLRLLPFVLIIFLAYAAIGLPLATIPIFVHESLGYGTLGVGVIVALQSLATLLTRASAGYLCDSRGGKVSSLAGAACFGGSGAFYLLSIFASNVTISLMLLAMGRLLGGLGESLVITGVLAWSIAAVGGEHTGKAMVWTGIGTYGAIAAGAPLGLVLHTAMGFGSVAVAVVATSLVAGLMASLMPAVRSVAGPRIPFHRVVGLIWRQGAGLALANIGFGAISAFIALDFVAQAWSGAGIAVSGFAVGYMLARLFCGQFPDRFGGTKVAIYSLMLEVVGLVIVWMAASPTLAQIGTFLTGAGLSLVFPSLGVEAVRRVPVANRGAALGAYVMFFDVGLAVAGPATGIVAKHLGYPAAFGAGAVAAAIGLLITASSKARR